MNNQNYQMPQGKQCKYCKQIIDPTAKICPFCRKQQKHSGCFIAFVAVSLSIIAFMFLLGFIFSTKNPSGTQPETRIQTQPAISEEEYKELCKDVTYEELARDKNAFKGQKLKFTGRIIQVKDNIYRMNITKTSWGYDDTILFTFNNNKLDKNVLEHDIVTIWGESEGFYTYESILKQEVTVPKIKGMYLENHGQE